MSALTTAESTAVASAAARGTQANHGSREFLTFRLGAEEYGIDILRVQEIRSYENPTRIANAPAFIKGVINLRGVIVPIVDLRLKFNLSEAEYNAFTVVIILNIAKRVVGAVVDSVSDVLELDGNQIKPAPEFNSMLEFGYITGLATIAAGVSAESGAADATTSTATAARDRMLILIDIERLMSGADMALMESQAP
jgi:purine-binding chemotaxis protein CheW